MKAGKAAAKLVFAVLFLCSMLVAPAHAVSMTAMAIEPAAHTTAMPCPMMGDHGASEDGGVDEHAAMAVSCCPAPALGSALRHVLPVRIVTMTNVEPVWSARAALSDPGVDLQPPRG